MLRFRRDAGHVEQRDRAVARQRRAEMLQLVRCWDAVDADQRRHLPVIAGDAAHGATERAPVVQFARRICDAQKHCGTPLLRQMVAIAWGAAGLTGRTPRYGYHLPEQRRATMLLRIAYTPRELHDWGTLGGAVGRIAGDYWQVPALVGIDRIPTSDELKHFGAALASYGSVALFHVAGVTPEAEHAVDSSLAPTATITEADLRAFQAAYRAHIDTVDVVVFSAPQLSLMELRDLAAMLAGRRATIPLLVVTSPQVKPDADRFGLTASIEAAGGLVLAGMCFYQRYAREMAEANGWRTLVTPSAKLVNILGGYGYRPALLSMQECVDAACSGRIAA